MYNMSQYQAVRNHSALLFYKKVEANDLFRWVVFKVITGREITNTSVSPLIKSVLSAEIIDPDR